MYLTNAYQASCWHITVHFDRQLSGTSKWSESPLSGTPKWSVLPNSGFARISQSTTKFSSVLDTMAIGHAKPWSLCYLGGLTDSPLTKETRKKHVPDRTGSPKKNFSQTRPFWAELVIELPCPCVCLYVPSSAVFFKASHWPSDHMIRSRPLIGQPPLLGGGGDSETR